MSNSEDGSAKRAGSLYISSVEKAFRVLEMFGASSGDLSLPELAERSGLDKSSVQRCAHTLWQLGYLEKDPRTRHFSPGKPALDLAFNYLRSNHLIELATPALAYLRELCGERVSLSLFDGTSMVYAIRQQTRREYFDGSLVGRRVPTFCTAGGRAAMSRLANAEVQDILGRSDLLPRTSKTITDSTEILRLVDCARKTGFSLSVEEIALGEVTIASAVSDHSGRPVAAIHIAAKLTDWTPDSFCEKFAPQVVEVAQSLSRTI